jgi:hypothetical protein
MSLSISSSQAEKLNSAAAIAHIKKSFENEKKFFAEKKGNFLSEISTIFLSTVLRIILFFIVLFSLIFEIFSKILENQLIMAREEITNLTQSLQQGKLLYYNIFHLFLLVS